MQSSPELLPHAPVELTSGRLRRIGEGIGKVVYASDHWVVRRERSPSEIVALIVLWKAIRKMERVLPRRMTGRMLAHPSKQLRVLRVFIQFGMLILPKSLWFTSHIRQMWTMYHRRSVRGERLAQTYLADSEALPRRIAFPPVRVAILGWPGWLIATDAVERVESTLYQRLVDLAEAGRYDELEQWLDRFLELRQYGWQHGVFSVDAHFKNFGVSGDRIVLLDSGGLTNRWSDIEDRLVFEESAEQPHIHLGLENLLRPRPDIAERFDARWKSIVNREVVGRHWPS